MPRKKSYKKGFYLLVIICIIQSIFLIKGYLNKEIEVVRSDDGVQKTIRLTPDFKVDFYQGPEKQVTEVIMTNLKSDQSFTHKFGQDDYLKEYYFVNLEEGNDLSFITDRQNIKLIRGESTDKREFYLHFKDQGVHSLNTHFMDKEASTVVYGEDSKIDSLGINNWPERNTKTWVRMEAGLQNPIIRYENLRLVQAN